MFSDGLYDSVNDKHQRFGRDRLIELLRNESSDNLASRVVENVHKFTGNAKQADDITVISLGCTEDHGA
jgi:serine phosphatase RsbU (regulator of sigma subunit)